MPTAPRPFCHSPSSPASEAGLAGVDGTARLVAADALPLAPPLAGGAAASPPRVERAWETACNTTLLVASGSCMALANQEWPDRKALVKRPEACRAALERRPRCTDNHTW